MLLEVGGKFEEGGGKKILEIEFLRKRSRNCTSPRGEERNKRRSRLGKRRDARKEGRKGVEKRIDGRELVDNIELFSIRFWFGIDRIPSVFVQDLIL